MLLSCVPKKCYEGLKYYMWNWIRRFGNKNGIKQCKNIFHVVVRVWLTTEVNLFVSIDNKGKIFSLKIKTGFPKNILLCR